ncbi:DNA-binding response OmpR family regulator [Pseudoxanthomonas winnipegensis]|nr:DNA-binding response OmpR family regulator [Pseudoxanthomonas winnipegensis]
MTAAADNALVLVVEDEPRLAAVLRDYLHAAGYRSAWVADGDAVLDAVAAHGPALVLLDLMLPGRDGVDVCRALRAVSQVPVIMVTARVEEIDRLLGLEVGADDYICKPFSPKEVIARVGAVLRRVRQGQPEPPIPGLTIDQANGRALLHGQALDLTAVESSVCCARCWGRPAGCGRASACSIISTSTTAWSPIAPSTATCATCAASCTRPG